MTIFGGYTDNSQTGILEKNCLKIIFIRNFAFSLMADTPISLAIKKSETIAKHGLKSLHTFDCRVLKIWHMPDTQTLLD